MSVLRDINLIMPYKHEKKKSNHELINNVLMLGPKSPSHWLWGLRKAVEKDGYDVKYLGRQELKDLKVKTDPRRETYISAVLDALKPWRPELILIDQDNFPWVNTSGITTVYHHREFFRPPTVFYPHLALFQHGEVIEHFNRYHAPWMAQIRSKRVLVDAVDPSVYKPGEKTLKGLIGIGGRDTFKDVYSLNEITKVAVIRIQAQELEQFKKLEALYVEPPVSNEQYIKILSKCKATWFFIATKQYVTRRMFEAMASKTLCVFRLENDAHERFLASIGLENRVHYVGIDDVSEALTAYIETTNKEDIIENAYILTLSKHSFTARWNEIKEYLRDLK